MDRAEYGTILFLERCTIVSSVEFPEPLGYMIGRLQQGVYLVLHIELGNLTSSYVAR